MNTSLYYKKNYIIRVEYDPYLRKFQFVECNYIIFRLPQGSDRCGNVIKGYLLHDPDFTNEQTHNYTV